MNDQAKLGPAKLYDRSINHPEREFGEVWVLNIQDDDFSWRIISWVTKRKGRVAYDPSGEPVPGMVPVFVQRAELEISGIDIEGVYQFLKKEKWQTML
ncbi:MAG TPA: hypothetical protein VFK07_00615 [Candidatus Paceibacterota bacterium]|nr:hypothetical protein [Candidatus Paceibacterota bacterium]